MSNNKDDKFFKEQLFHRMEALKNGKEIPYKYKTENEKIVEAITEFLTNYKFRIVCYVFVILIMLLYKHIGLDIGGTKELLDKTNTYIAKYGTSAQPYYLHDEIKDDDLIRIKIYGKTLGEAKTELKEVIERDKSRQILPNVIIGIFVVIIITEISHVNNKKRK